LGLDRIEMTVAERANQLRTMLTDLGLTVYDEGVQRCGIVTTASSNIASADLRAALSRRSINASTTSVGSSRYDVERRNLPDMLRLSVHCTTTVDEIERATAALGAII
jgi:selenocysteine lyase/cysteine desulfurase